MRLENMQINNVSFYFKKLKRKAKINPKQAEKEVIKIRAEINETIRSMW